MKKKSFIGILAALIFISLFGTVSMKSKADVVDLGYDYDYDVFDHFTDSRDYLADTTILGLTFPAFVAIIVVALVVIISVLILILVIKKNKNRNNNSGAGV